MKRFGPRHAAIIIVVAGLLLAINFAVAPRRRALQTRDCQTNLKQISLAMMQYVRDYDEKYPLAHNWMDVTTPYAARSATNRAVEARYLCPTSGAFYAYNANLQNSNIARTDAQTVWFFDAQAGGNQRNFSGDGADWPVSPVHQQHPNWGNNVVTGDANTKFAERKPPASAFLPTPAF